MPTVVLTGEKKKYIFSVIIPEAGNFPEWGGVYLAVNASTLGIRMEECVAVGACTSFKEYESKILGLTKGKCTHIYLLPEFDAAKRSFALEDLARTEAFAGVPMGVPENQEPLFVEKEEKSA